MHVMEQVTWSDDSGVLDGGVFSSSGVVASGVRFCLGPLGVFLPESSFDAAWASFSDEAGVEGVADSLAGVANVCAAAGSCLISTTTGMLLADFTDESSEDFAVDFSGVLATDFTGVLGVLLRGFGDGSADMPGADDAFLGVVSLAPVEAVAVSFSGMSAPLSGAECGGEAGSSFTLTL